MIQSNYRKPPAAKTPAYPLAIRQLMLYEALLDNPCEFPNVKSLAFHVRLVDGWKSTPAGFA